MVGRTYKLSFRKADWWQYSMDYTVNSQLDWRYWLRPQTPKNNNNKKKIHTTEALFQEGSEAPGPAGGSPSRLSYYICERLLDENLEALRILYLILSVYILETKSYWIIIVSVQDQMQHLMNVRQVLISQPSSQITTRPSDFSDPTMSNRVIWSLMST